MGYAVHWILVQNTARWINSRHRELCMNIKVAATLLLAAAILFVAPARADRIRSGSSYGLPGNPQMTSIGTETLVPVPPDMTEGDLVLQIIPSSPFLGDPIQVNVTLSSTEFVLGTGTFGVINCPPIQTTLALCTPVTNPACDLSGVTPQAGTITLPGSCNVANETFYFDEPSTGTTFDTIGPFAEISAVTPTTTPEPSSLALLCAGLFSLALLSRRLLHS
jgi:hypothetical protein